MFSIEEDHINGRINATFSGIFEYDAADLVAGIKGAIPNVRRSDGTFDLLSDFTEASVMPQDHAQASEDFLGWLDKNGLRKSAVVMTSVTQRMQVQRVSDRSDKLGYFGNRAEAEKWLTED